MKRLKIMKSYVVLWLFIYFLIYSSIDYILVFFMATLTFNLAVLTVLVIGIIMVVKAAINLVMLAGTFGTLAYKKDNLNFYLKDIDRIMPANIAYMFHSRAEKGMLLFTTEESRDVIDWIEEKFSHQNRYTNYFTGTVLMIGLLGTFSGLLIAIDDMGRIILSLSGNINLAKVISDFSGPLGGMAVGFGSSLFGVIAAIILGLKGYILNKNQEVFVEGVEDWLKGRIIDSGGSGTSILAAEGSELPEHKASFMDVFIENLSDLTQEMSKLSQSNEQITSLTLASVKQTRADHENSIGIFEEINKSLQNIDVNAQNTTHILKEQFSSLQISMNSNHEQLIVQQQSSVKYIMEKIENSLDLTHTKITEKLQELSDNKSDEFKAISSEILELLNNINFDLKVKQKSLLKIQESDQNNHEINHKLLEELSFLFKESSNKLDAEFNLLNKISNNVELSNEKSKDNFALIRELINSFTKILQDELETLSSLKSVQENQSKIIQDSVERSKDIDEILKDSQLQAVKQNEQIESISLKIESMRNDFLDSSKVSFAQQNDEIGKLASKINEVTLKNQTKSTNSDKKEASFLSKIFK